MGGLFERFDIRPEERIALLALDEIAFPVIFWGGINAGVVPVALNTLLSTDVYSTILQDCRARALFVSAALYPTVEPLLAEHPYVRHVFVIGERTHQLAHMTSQRHWPQANQAKHTPLAPMTVRILALFIGVDWAAKGCPPCAFQPAGDLRYLCLSGARHPGG